jgi:peptidoglycan hydrolase-like amidase
MSRDTNNNNDSVPFVKIVYTTVKTNGKVELVPLEWYADGSVRKGK